MSTSTAAYIPYAQRSGWTDLVPILQADAPNCLVPIAYAENYRDAMDTFRALVHANEKSARGIELTEALIRLNPGHYSIWAYRALILLETHADLNKELDLMDELVKEHLKSYQVWQHRRTIVLALDDSSRELPFTSRTLSFDAKNYHTWAYRQWVLSEFFSSDEAKDASVWEGELRYAEGLLAEDLRNNSAWNHRFFCVFESGRRGEGEESRTREIEFVKSKLALAPNNPSAWNYLRGVLTKTSTPLASLVPFVAPFAVDPSPSAEKSKLILPAFLAIEFLADACAEEAKKLAGGKGSEKGAEAAALFASLVEHDPIRTKYWQYRAKAALAVKA